MHLLRAFIERDGHFPRRAGNDCSWFILNVGALHVKRSFPPRHHPPTGAAVAAWSPFGSVTPRHSEHPNANQTKSLTDGGEGSRSRAIRISILMDCRQPWVPLVAPGRRLTPFITENLCLRRRGDVIHGFHSRAMLDHFGRSLSRR